MEDDAHSFSCSRAQLAVNGGGVWEGTATPSGSWCFYAALTAVAGPVYTRPPVPRDHLRKKERGERDQPPPRTPPSAGTGRALSHSSTNDVTAVGTFARVGRPPGRYRLKASQGSRALPGA
ncbi:hypothetical protein MTO96_014316 [Rhipicephalus appendiculatus]